MRESPITKMFRIYKGRDIPSELVKGPNTRKARERISRAFVFAREGLLTGRRDKHGRRCEEFHVLQFGLYLHALILPFGTAAAREGQEILVVQVRVDFFKIGLDGNRSGDSEKVSLGASILGKLAQIILCVVQQEK